MSTHQELVNGVISDMAKENEEGITSAVSNALSLSINHYEQMPFWFLEQRYEFTTVNGTEFYDLPSDFGATQISLVLTVNNNTYPLNERTYQYLEDVYIKGTIFSGYPTDFATWGEQLRLYPVPNGSYTATLSYAEKLGLPSSDGGSNAWTTDAEMLIRSRAEWQLYSLRYHDAEAASICKQAEESALRGLMGAHSRRTMTGSTRRRAI